MDVGNLKASEEERKTLIDDGEAESSPVNGLASFGTVPTLFDDTLQPHNMFLAYCIFSARIVF
jgi:hypothetical protein